MKMIEVTLMDMLDERNFPKGFIRADKIIGLKEMNLRHGIDCTSIVCAPDEKGQGQGFIARENISSVREKIRKAFEE